MQALVALEIASWLNHLLVQDQFRHPFAVLHLGKLNGLFFKPALGKERLRFAGSMIDDKPNSWACQENQMQSFAARCGARCRRQGKEEQALYTFSRTRLQHALHILFNFLDMFRILIYHGHYGISRPKARFARCWLKE